MFMDEKLMTLPVIALRGLTVLPEMIQHFDISRDKSISAVEHAMVGEQKVFLVTQRQIEEEDPDASGLFQIGTIARIKQLVKIPGGLVRVMVVRQVLLMYIWKEHIVRFILILQKILRD